MLGIVLCGGQGSHRGGDNGLLIHEAKTWAQTALEKLSVLNIPVMFSVNEHQHNEYAKVFKPELLITDDATLEIKGPLLGVLSAHLQHPGKDLFVLSCDLPLMDFNLVIELYSLYQESKKYDVYIFSNDKEPEPLCGIYSAKAFKKIIALQKQHKLVKHTMKFALSNLVACEIALQYNQKKYFRNFNAHAGLNET